MAVEELVGSLRAVGLDGFALTDHNAVRGHEELRALAGARPDVLLLPGVEISTREGHLLLYGVEEAPPAHRPFSETLEWAERRGAVAVPAHPFRWTHGVGRRISESATVPALEVLNGHNGPGANRRAATIAAHRGLGATGGSDAHLPGELGRAYTVFPDSARSLEGLIDSLCRGRTTAGGSAAPLLHRARSGLRSGVLRISRGLRPI